MKKTVEVQYSCALCRLKDAPVKVPAREVDVVDWVEHIVMPRVARDHQQRSPGCCPKTLQNLKLPISDDKVGG